MRVTRRQLRRIIKEARRVITVGDDDIWNVDDSVELEDAVEFFAVDPDAAEFLDDETARMLEMFYGGPMSVANKRHLLDKLRKTQARIGRFWAADAQYWHGYER